MQTGSPSQPVAGPHLKSLVRDDVMSREVSQ